jgi:AcrR family transcriptional regulator
MSERITRANGEASRKRILDAAAEIAGERGYAGTSISHVMERSGLPKSSIYWHFTDKDALFAAVIKDSYERWIEEFSIRAGTGERSPAELVVLLHDSLADVPAFLRFGHLVTLEQSDHGARAEFLEIRRISLRNLAQVFALATGADDRLSESLAAVALALVDGAFIARAAGEHGFDDSSVLGAAFGAYAEAATSRHARPE